MVSKMSQNAIISTKLGRIVNGVLLEELRYF